MTSPDSTTYPEPPATPASFTQVAVTKVVDFTTLANEVRTSLGITADQYLSITLIDAPGTVEKPAVLSVGLPGRAFTVAEIKGVVDAHQPPAQDPAPAPAPAPEVVSDPALEPAPQ